jgi:RHS repeat-associated protein
LPSQPSQDSFLAAQSKEFTCPWKRQHLTLGTDITPYVWVGGQGYYNDEETGLYQLGNGTRYYDPQTAQFLSADPIGFAGGDPNLYRYANSSPAQNTDPSGLYTIHEVIWAINNPKCAIAARQITTEVLEDLKWAFGPLERDDDTVENAVKHCTWMCSVASDPACSRSQTWELGVAHEDYEGNDPHGMQMDLHNNFIGILLSKEGQTIDQCFDKCVKAAQQFWLYWFKPTRLAEWGTGKGAWNRYQLPWDFPKWKLKDILRKDGKPFGGRSVIGLPNFGGSSSCPPKFEGGPSRKE